MSWNLKYGKHVEVKPICDIPAVFDMEDMCYVFRFKNHINDVRAFMRYLYAYRRRTWKFERDRSFPLLMDVIKKRKYLNTHLIIRLVEWGYIDNDGFWLRDRGPLLKDAIFITLATRDYIKKHKHAKTHNK